MSEVGKPLATLTIRGTPLPECAFVEVTPEVRVYYTTDRPGSGFDFYVTEWVSGTRAGYYDLADEWATYECLFHGVAYSDGLRHLYMGHAETDTEGYLYYAKPRTLAAIFASLDVLESEYCPHR